MKGMNMKPSQTNEPRKKITALSTFKGTCQASCQRLLTRITRAKATIFGESYRALQAQERLLRLALNEAEAMAWQTAYPHLVFPTLATEKVQAVAAWHTRQQSLRPAKSVLA